MEPKVQHAAVQIAARAGS
uniref:Uncharacterized protein n=1 Tax=Arundo donax TaxID=35708 RepID=A0A0A8ZNS6_ARUDO